LIRRRASRVSASLLDVLVGQRVRLIVTREEGDRAKGEEPSYREEEVVGQLLHLPSASEDAKVSGLTHHSVYSADGKRHAIWDGDVRRVEVLDPATDDVILFAKCTGESGGRTVFGPPKHGRAQCCLHEIHAGRPLGRQSPVG
jgi:hypothetical protein